jgi:hypothetical protein
LPGLLIEVGGFGIALELLLGPSLRHPLLLNPQLLLLQLLGLRHVQRLHDSLAGT